MAQIKIEWSVEAKSDLFDILEFYHSRNGNTIYSKKLYLKINKSISLLAKNPFLGKQTDDPSVRVLMTGDYQILYEVFENFLLIVMIWDSRRDPEDKISDTRRK
ncbi:MAG TPA: type II toxin-antitoxin system RelE/ParE family toxin [Bacteroidales bacterium]|nr:type II toxin-antitoxin system RelE/ParE family toxin [Bacteroidales bacterium]